MAGLAELDRRGGLQGGGWGHARDTRGASADGRFAGGKAVVFEERYVCEGSS